MTGKAVEEMTYEERKALPAKYHQPVWDGLGSPHSWICEVCWDDGLTSAWPCEVAAAPAGTNGLEIARAGGMRYAW